MIPLPAPARPLDAAMLRAARDVMLDGAGLGGKRLTSSDLNRAIYVTVQVCPQCGTPLQNDRQCDYCGTRFEAVGATRNFNTPIQVNTTPGISARDFERAAARGYAEGLPQAPSHRRRNNAT